MLPTSRSDELIPETIQIISLICHPIHLNKTFHQIGNTHNK